MKFLKVLLVFCLIAGVLFAGFSFYYFGMLKDETDLKYKYEMKY